MRTSLLHWLRTAWGLALGAATALGGVLYLLVAAPWPRARRPAPALARLERRRIAACYGADLGPVPRDPRRALGFLAARCVPGLLGGAVLVTAVVGAGYASLLLWGWFALPLWDQPLDVMLTAAAGVFLLFLCVQGVYAVALLEIRLARRFFGPDDREALQRRIGELAESRAGVVEAVHDERRRIERDLHDGVQQRLVALGLVLGRARRSADPAKADVLMGQAHEEAQRALGELREVAWRVYPATLDEGGLAAALETVAERAGIAGVPVRLAVELETEPPDAVRAMAYFVAAEAVTNAVKHSGASAVALTVTSSGTLVTVRAEDDGRGGADPAGGGLTGLSRRVAALDGRFTVDSPVGGPTLIEAELPCV